MKPVSYKHAFPLSVRLLHLYLFIICVGLTVLLYLGGGATNPFVSLYLVPIAISAATLSPRFTIPLTIFCLLAYSFLMVYFQPLPILSPPEEMVLHSDHHQMHMTESSKLNLHIVGMWINFGLSALLITWFVTRMAEALRTRETELSAIREKQLRDEQLLGIATLAAGTMHELGTPLATMAILTDDLKKSSKNYPELEADAALLFEQVSRCKNILQNLAKAAEQQQSGELQRVSINDYIQGVLTHWQLLRPSVPLKIQSIPVSVCMYVDATLEQALINLLNNAAEASPQGIEVSLLLKNEHDHPYVHFCIRDHGTGIRLDAEKVGKPFVSTRGQGRGLGLFLSNAAIERLDGRVTLENHLQGGTVATVIFPCDAAA